MKLTSTAFQHKAKIPSKYTCDGQNINPPLKFSDVPKEAKSLVLIMDDPDVPKNLRPDGMFDHWLMFNIPAQTSEIEENSEPEGMHGTGTSGKPNYFGPCPPDREHRYFFKLYALDDLLDLPELATKKDIEEAMEGHIIDQAELVGLYKRSLD